jgi:hypothetical protein
MTVFKRPQAGDNCLPHMRHTPRKRSRCSRTLARKHAVRSMPPGEAQLQKLPSTAPGADPAGWRTWGRRRARRAAPRHR